MSSPNPHYDQRINMSGNTFAGGSDGRLLTISGSSRAKLKHAPWAPLDTRPLEDSSSLLNVAQHEYESRLGVTSNEPLSSEGSRSQESTSSYATELSASSFRSFDSSEASVSNSLPGFDSSSSTELSSSSFNSFDTSEDSFSISPRLGPQMYTKIDDTSKFALSNSWLEPYIHTPYQFDLGALHFTSYGTETNGCQENTGSDMVTSFGDEYYSLWNEDRSDSMRQGNAEVSADRVSIGPQHKLYTPRRTPSSRKFRCWVASCPQSDQGFSTIKGRKDHYNSAHPELILKCRKSGCKFQSFLREMDRAKHEAKIHPENDFSGSSGEIQKTEADLKSGGDYTEQDTTSTDETSEHDEASKRLFASEKDASTHRCSVGPDSQKSFSTYSDGTVGFDTDSAWSEAESEWEEDCIDPRELLAQTIEDSKVSVRPLLSPMKKKLVEGIMREFWAIFNQEWSANIRECAQGSPTSTSSAFSQRDNGPRESSNNGGRKRGRESGDDEEPGDDNGKNPKRPKTDASSLGSTQSVAKFACPYRKHDPQVYSHQTRRWRSCALTPLDTIARVKGHLYRYHRIFQCARCKALYGNANELEKHGLEVKGCEVKEEPPADGITGSIEKKLRSRKKAHRDQSEPERWREMYKILFPEEGIPSPCESNNPFTLASRFSIVTSSLPTRRTPANRYCAENVDFQSIQDDSRRSPDSEEMTSYEEYSRRELPRFFQSALEDAIADEAQPVEERLKSRLVGMIKDCQDRVFSTYKARRSTNTPGPARAEASSQSPLAIVQENTNRREDDQTGIIETLYARVPPPAQLPAHVETAVERMASKPIPVNVSFDSGYGSDLPVSNSESSSSKYEPGSESTTTNSSQEQKLPETPQEVRQTNSIHAPYSIEEPLKQDVCGYMDQDMSTSQSAIDMPFPWDGLEDFDVEKWMSLSSVQTEGEGMWHGRDSFG